MTEICGNIDDVTTSTNVSIIKLTLEIPVSTKAATTSKKYQEPDEPYQTLIYHHNILGKQEIWYWESEGLQKLKDSYNYTIIINLCDYFIPYQYKNLLFIMYHYFLWEYLLLTLDMIICGMYAWHLGLKMFLIF